MRRISNSFRALRNRDAWATIRGYCYQVTVTIHSWLLLKPGLELELECGEDIDLIQHALSDEHEEPDRLLEQVKDRVKNVTIRSPEALGALASFHEHRTINPEIQLTFRYLTTAKAGREHPAPFPDKMSGILAWELVRQGRAEQVLERKILAGIRTVLAESPRPPRLRLDTWSSFSSWVADAKDEELLQFIRSFEWSVQRETGSSYEEQITSLLVETGKSATRDEAKDLYARLFLHVFKLLSQSGLKRLTVDNLEGIVARPALAPLDRKMLATLSNVLKFLDRRVADLEESVAEIPMLVTQEVQSIVRKEVGLKGELDYSAQNMPLDIPPLVENVTHRAKTVQQLLEKWRSATWLALCGDVGSGKTQLAILIARADGRRPIWIRLRNLDSGQSVSAIDEALELATSLRPSARVADWYSRACDRLGSTAMIVIDDLPRTDGDTPLDLRLTYLVKACGDRGLHIFSTGSDDLPAKVVEQVGSLAVVERVPAFTEEEIEELLRAHGAPSPLFSRTFIAFLKTVTQGHPILLAAAARHLAQKGYQTEHEAVEDLLGRGYVERLSPTTQRILKATVPDSRSRELLYRLNLIGLAVTENEINQLSQVGPAIEFPLEKLEDLKGLWIQQESGGSYLISPLLTDLGKKNLPFRTQRGVHLAYAYGKMDKGKLGILDAVNIFTHFLAAREDDTAASFLVLALMSLVRHDPARTDDWGLASAWITSRMPSGVSLRNRLLLRSLQVVIHRLRHKPTDHLQKELDTNLSVVGGKDAFVAFGACFWIVLYLCQQYPSFAAQYLVKAMSLLSLIRSAGQPVPGLDRLRPEDAFWWLGTSMQSVNDLQSWKNALLAVDPETRARVLSSPIADEACVIISDKIWILEEKKPASARDWDSVVKILNKLGEFAQEVGSSILRTASMRTQVVVLAESKQDLVRAVRLADQALGEIDADETQRFLILEVTGRQLLYAGKWNEALSKLDSAVRADIASFPLLRMRALLSAAEAAAASGKDWDLACQYTEKAVVLAKESEKIQEPQVVEALLEHAIALWYQGKNVLTYQHCHEGVQRLLSAREEGKEWKGLFVTCGYVLGYFVSVAALRKPPSSEEKPPAPKLTMFGRGYSELSRFYDPAKEWGLFAQLAMFAEAVGEDDTASEWALRAMQEGQQWVGQEWASSMVVYGIAQAILEDRYVDAIEYAADYADSLYSQNRAAKARRDAGGAIPPEIDDAKREELAILLSVVPVAYRLATIWLVDKHASAERAAAVVQKCGECASLRSPSQVWAQSAKVLEAVFVRETSGAALIEMGKCFSDSEEHILAISVYVGVMLHNRPEAGALYQLASLPYLERNLHVGGIYRRVCVPFVQSFWDTQVATNPFYFNRIAVIRSEIQRAKELPQEKSIRAILSAVISSLAIRVTDEHRKWIHQKN